ncbi:aspartate-alanine antiporter [Caulobacter mirabilis]|uniref:Aspartate-alanine antiporter n=1 Tax=Caulobacter mirabilis TaxID=69666 RepID=A0A2D2AZY7_9CAUL|nr:aspartate-alanine antiporter [Caulobacter mirabilis]ATQ43578.1 aspartate-alanine antiporter [Caulobacter mirabilis]
MIQLLADHPEMALFLSLALGHLIGRLKVGPVQLGGVCGTLIVALVIGQTGVKLDADLKNLAFALFIFALGFTGGPQFFGSLRQSWRYGTLSLIEVVVVLTIVLSATALLSLDPGTAAGLLAGSATESAVIGTAAEAVQHLGLPAEEAATQQAHIATAYSVTYLFGLITIVLFTSQIAPFLLRIDLKAEAAALAEKLGGGASEAAGALPDIVGRAYEAGAAAGATVSAFERSQGDRVLVERIGRDGRYRDATPDEVIRAGDVLLLVGRREAIVALGAAVGPENDAGDALNTVLERRPVVLGRSKAVGHTVADLRELTTPDLHRGVFVSRIERMGQAAPVLPGTVLRRGDVVHLLGPRRAVDAAARRLGRTLPPVNHTSFIMVGVGVLAGILIGQLAWTVGGVRLTLGGGGGCLLSGLAFGWFAARRPDIAALPPAAAEILKDFGLAAFIAAIGLAAGPDAIRLIGEYGIALPIVGVLAASVPATASLFIGRHLLKIEPPILLGAIAGQQCSTPAISALVGAAGNATPVIGYTVTYALSNVLLPLLGPLVVGLAARMA